MNPSTINISNFPSVELEMRAQLPQTPCIYFAIDSSGEVQYIGQSIGFTNHTRTYDILLNYKGMGEQQLIEMANDCQVSLKQLKALLAGQPINEHTALVFSNKINMSVEDFIAQYPVVRL